MIDRSVSFGFAAVEYDRHRPAPPRQVLSWMLSGDERVVLDLAAGTGQISRQLRGRVGLDVVAVEPDEAMRSVLVRRCPGVRVLDGLAERLPLEDDSVDAVLVGSAWHWFDHDLAVPEVARVLRIGGRLAAVGTSPDSSVSWVAELFGGEGAEHEALNRRHYTDVRLSSSFGPVETYDLAFASIVVPSAVEALFATSSRWLMASDAERAALQRRLRRTLAGRVDEAGRVELPLRARSWRSRRRAEDES